MTAGGRLRRPTTLAIGVLALLAYLPALSAAPGRMPSDSKLYLYLDPGRFLGDAASSFDPRQFAGWVPHQHISYLWPSGPWFWLFDVLGVPDWVAHRLWIGTLLVAAGAGVRWTARLLGFGQTAALSAAVVYQLSLYVLPYISRTSVMLLPWAGLGWIVAFTIRASRRRTWGDPAAIALVVFTVGAVNATALVMIIPGPLLWLVHAAWLRAITWRQAGLVALRTGLLSAGVSLWWVVMLIVQGRYGTDVLPYSESLADVSLTATSTEVWRSLGYWLFYVRDPAGAATSASLRYLVSTPAIVASYLVPLAALASLAALRWAHRRFAILLVVAGIVLAVGVHPVTDRSPLWRVLAGDDDGGLALALRSSTRALPVLMLGIAIALAMAIQAASTVRLPRLGWAGHHVVAIAVVSLAVVNLPSLWTGGFVDPQLERDQDPPQAWLDASASLDGASGADARVLQLPGAEFGSYRWGHTVDQPLPGMTDPPLVTRDLLPLGSAGTMDLLYALDDRIQDGVFEPSSLAPVASLLGADTVWLANDIAFDRYRTARPEVVRDLVLGAPGVAAATTYGEPFLNRAVAPMTDERALGDPRVGEPLRPVEIVALNDGGTMVRASRAELVLSGSGDGLVDAAASGLLAPDRIVTRYSADLTDAGTADPIGLIVTDSNRDRARHWRSSQDVTGFTESGGPDDDLLRPVSSDARFEVFESTDPATQTVALQRGSVTATATSYGEPFAYLPEHRAVMSIDGDPTTAWLVGEHGDPVGESIRLEYDGRTTALTLQQPMTADARRITRVRVVEEDPTSSVRESVVELDERSWGDSGQVIPLGSGATSGSVEVVIEATAGGTPFTGSAVAGVGFSEIDVGLGSTEEVVRPPHDALAVLTEETPLALTFSRLRVDPMDRWREDPEPALVREFDLPGARTFAVDTTVRIDARADEQALADLFGWPAVASSRLTGSPRHAGVSALDGDPATAWMTAFDEADGARLWIVGATDAIEQIELRQPVAGFSSVEAITVRSGAEERFVELIPDAAGTAIGEVSPPLPPGNIEIVLSEVTPTTTIDRRFGDPVTLPAAVSEVVFEGRPDVVPIREQRLDVECATVGSIGGVDLQATLSITDGAWLDGGPIVATTCVPSVDLDAGTHLVRGSTPGLPFTLDRVVLDAELRAALATTTQSVGARVLERGRFGRTIEVVGCTEGCWLVLGEGYNEAWTAEGPDGSLGRQEMVDGGFNGWWIEATEGPIRVDVRWTAQRPLWIGFGVSLLAVCVAVALVVAELRRRPDPVEQRAEQRAGRSAADMPSLASVDRRLSRRTALIAGATWVIGAGLLIGPSEALWGLAAGAVLVATRRRRLGELTALASLLVIAVGVTVRERRSAPLPNGAWPGTFESLHALGMFAVVCLIVAAVSADDTELGYPLE